MNSSSRPIVIDDTSSRIKYIGRGWFEDQGSQDAAGNFGPTYLHTQHGTNSNNSFAFSFNGTSIKVLGTTALDRIPITNGTGNGTTFDPKWECFIDNISIGSTPPFQFAENNWVLCEEPSLLDTRHVLSVNVTTMGNTFWLDQLQYTPSRNAVPPNGTQVVMVSHTDPGVKFGGGWTSLGDTANCTTKLNSKLKFNFTGTSLTWLGFVPTELSHNPADATYAIDDDSPVRFRLNGLPPDPKVATAYNQVFFTTPDLQQKEHTIEVTYLGNGSVTPLVLTHMYITSNRSPTKGDPGGLPSAVLGGILAGVISVLVVAALIFLFFYRRKKLRESKLRIEDPVSAGEISPFMTTFLPTEVTTSQPPLPPSTLHQSGKNRASASRTTTNPISPMSSGILSAQGTSVTGTSEVGSGSAASGVDGEAIEHSTGQTGAGGSTMTRPSRKRQPEHPSGQRLPDPVHRQHEDSGMRLRTEVDVPPVYTYD